MRRQYAQANRAQRNEGKPETFDFLGFTHCCARRWKDGGFALRRKTSRKRLNAKAKAVRQSLLRLRNRKPAEVGRCLRSVVTGHLNYFSVPGNQRACNAFRTLINRAWVEALRKRSQKNKSKGWPVFERLIKTWIPSVRVRHPYPNQRLVV